MTLTQRRGWWFGTDADDLDAYLVMAEPGGYAVQEVRHPRCLVCPEQAGFRLALDDEEGAAVRRCAACADEVVMLDGADVLAEAELGDAACTCGHEGFDLAVGYALTEDGEVRWVSVALRCQRDDLVAVYTDWKIDYSPSRHLLDQA